ncbi:MAG TPA: MBOAT family protein [Firmicutes bacterium]|nr:MBOAT family protein [Bacillota bacterium]
MVFSSLTFLFGFLPFVLLLYYLVPRSWRNGILFIVSLVFYGWGEPVYILLMLFSTVVDYTCALGVDRNRSNQRKARRFLLASVVINLSLLGFFKYADFVLQSLNSWLGTNIPLLSLALPIGISFYTFQTMSYTIDVYRGDAPVQRNIVSLGAYVTLFPQLIAGPIVRYSTVASQINEREETVDRFGQGVQRFVVGLGKKVLLANNIGLLFDQIKQLPGNQLSLLAAWLGVTAFALQVYFDFSGYSDMAIGLGKMFGFTFLENFNYPFMAQSITEFWRRWHISLGTWFRDYVYIPLGGSRRSEAITYRNLAVVWLLTGLWHGASWNFVFWGAYFAGFLMVEKAFLLAWLQRLPRLFRHVYALGATAFSWVLFAFEDWPSIRQFWQAMLGRGSGGSITPTDLYLLTNYGLLLVILVLAATPIPRQAVQRVLAIDRRPRLAELLYPAFIALVLGLSTAYLVDASYNPFLYFRF